jgi:hypothetical protein
MWKFNAATDITVAILFRELYNKFPNAKFIYTTRDIDSWLSSCEKHFTKKLLGMRLDQGNTEIVKICNIFYGDILFNESTYREAYYRHDDAVRDFFSDKKLLDFNVFEGDGYEKLCKFLCKNDINSPFPRENAANQ